MAERETRRQRRERIREEKRIISQQTRGRQRWQRRIVAVGTAIIIAVGGGIGVHQYLQNQEQAELFKEDEKSAQTLIQQEIERLGIQKSQKEIDLWGRVESELRLAREANALSAVKKLNVISQAMLESENPYFIDAINFVQDQYNQGNLGTGIDPTPINRQTATYSVINSGAEIINGEFKITLKANAEAMLERGSIDIAASQTHEKEHLNNTLQTDTPHLNAQQRYDIQARRFFNREEHVAEEARGYMKQAQAIIYYLGLTTDPEHLIDVIKSAFREHYTQKLVVNAIKFNNNPDDPGWKKFIERESLAD